MNTKIVLPEGAFGQSEDVWSDELRRLTRTLFKKSNEPMYGGLGGSDGYGYPFENKVFMMHPYCWCDEEDCPWCSGESPSLNQPGTSGSENFLYKPKDFGVWWYKWIGRSMAYEDGLNMHPSEVVDHCISSLEGG